jgi:hypothetical protein
MARDEISESGKVCILDTAPCAITVETVIFVAGRVVRPHTAVRTLRTGGRRLRRNAILARERSLFPLNHPTGDAVAGVSRRVGFHVVCLGMDHQRRASVGEQRVRVGRGAKRDIIVGDLRLRLAVRSDRDVQHVAGVVALRILEAVLPGLRIEVAACRLEVWRIALRVLVEVNAMLAGRQAVEVELDLDSAADGLDFGGADAVSLSILEFDFDAFGGSRGRSGRQQSNGEGDSEQFGFHSGHYSAGAAWGQLVKCLG